MADHALLAYNRTENVKLVLHDTNSKGSENLCNFQWMSHWVQANSSSSSQILKNCAVCDMSNKQACIKQGGYLESMKPKETKLLSIDLKSTRSVKHKNGWRSDPGQQNLASYVLQSSEAVRGEKGIFKITNNSIVSETYNAFGAEALGRVCVQKLPESYVNWENSATYHSLDSQSLSLNWMHFPMFGINRKMETILARKRKTSNGTVVVTQSELKLSQTESKLALPVTESASEENHDDQEVGPDECIRGLAASEDDSTGPDHNPVHRYNSHIPNMSAYICKCHCTSALMASEMQTDVRSFENAWTMSKDGSIAVGKSYSPGGIPHPHPHLTVKHGREIEHVSGRKTLPNRKDILRLSKSNDSGCIDHIPEKMAMFLTKNEGLLGMGNTLSNVDKRKQVSQKSSDGTQSLLINKKMRMNLSHDDQTVGELTFSANPKGNASFKMLTLPSIQQRHGQTEQNLQLQGRSSKNDEQEDSDGIDTPISEKQNESAIKTDTMYIDVCHTPCSVPGVTTLKSQKTSLGDVCPTMGGTTSAAALANRQATVRKGETELPDRKRKHVLLEMNRELSISQTESIDEDQVLSHVKKPENSLSNSPIEVTVDTESNSRWVKRLRHNTSNFVGLGSERTKMGDIPVEEAQNLFSRVVSYNTAICDLPTCQQLDETKLLPQNSEGSSDDSSKVITWMRRWCRSQKANPPPQTVLCEPENVKIPPLKFESKQFPSVAAMAMMGKMMNNSRPCSFKKKGSLIVWNS